MALREIFAEFGIQFDRRGDLARGERRVGMMTRTLRRLDPIVNAVTGQFAALAAAIGGAFMIRAIRSFVAGIVRVGDDLDKVGQQVGMSSRDLQAWRHAAELSGVDAAAFGNALGQLQRNAHEAERGTSTMVEAFRDLGITVTDTAGNLKSPNQLMLEMADGLAGIDNETQRTALAMTILGRSGRRMLPLFAHGSEGARAMLAELEELGGGMSDLSISESVKLNDELTRLRLVFTSLKSAIAQDLLPKIRAIVTWFIEARGVVQDLMRNSNIMRAVIIGAITAIVALLVTTLPVWGSFGVAMALVVLPAVALGFVIDELWTTLQGGESVLGNAGASIMDFALQSEWLADTISTLLTWGFRLVAFFQNLPAMLAGAWQSIVAGVDAVIARVQMLISTVQQAAAVISTLGGGGALSNLGGALSRLTGIGGNQRTEAQRQASIAASPAAQLRTMQPGGGARTVNSNVQAPSTVTVNVTEAQNPQATAAAVRGQIDTAWQQQLRGLRAASVPAPGTE